MRAGPGRRLLIAVLFYALAGSALLSARVRADEVRPRFELLHLWATGEEAYALRALSEPVRASGVDWSESRVSTNFIGVREQFAERLALGVPPSGLFWLGGNQAEDLFEQKLFRLFPNRVGNRAFSDELIPEIYQRVREGDSTRLLPLGIHLQNRMLYNADVLRRLGLAMPESWQELLNMAPALRKNGVHAVVFSDQRWQMRFFITSIMAEQFTFEEMGEFLAGTGSARKYEPQLRRSTEIFLALRPYASPLSRDLNWANVVEHVASGDSFAAFLGDFVAPMLRRNPAVHCSAAPGNDYVIWSFDAIALVTTEDPEVIAGQNRLIETVITPEVRQEYILRKGGIPAYRGSDARQMDACSQASMESWKMADTKMLLTASQWLQTLDIAASILRPAWWDPDADAAPITADLITAIDLMNQRDRPAPADR
ncbi:extracellular solute-binding protein [Paracoccus lutimaris]|uniref:extracellular solute-binding protein n=1 Tax=Paracoccus lutimaris TaxID=1490030 RepID=UPI0011C06F40|nr:extracellular solute-binding protein [Paracoccus lutimaris]